MARTGRVGPPEVAHPPPPEVPMHTPPATLGPDSLCPAAALVLAVGRADAVRILARLTPTIAAGLRSIETPED
jgi:hypothetical protein